MRRRDCCTAEVTEPDQRLKLLARVAPLFAAFYAALWLISIDFAHDIPRDGTGLVVGRDFLNLWMAGKAAWGVDPAQFYDLATYQAAMARFVGADYPGQIWSYPPSVMLIAAPFGQLPYVPALIVWALIGPVAFYAALRGWTDDKRLVLAAMLCPAAVFGLMSGQFAYLAAALMLTVLRWRHSRPIVAGALLGLLTIKPQLGLLFPLLLLVERNWRAIAAAALSTGAILAVTVLLWGPEPWGAYLTQGIANQSRVLSDPERLGAPFMATLFMNLRTIGVGVSAALIAQAVAAVLVAGLVGHAFWRRRIDDRLGAALFLSAAMVTTPYMLSYDSLAFATALLLAAPPGNRGRALSYAAYFLVLIQLALGNIGLPGAALIPIVAAIYLAKLAASSTWVDQRNCPTGLTQSSL